MLKNRLKRIVELRQKWAGRVIGNRFAKIGVQRRVAKKLGGSLLILQKKIDSIFSAPLTSAWTTLISFTSDPYMDAVRRLACYRRQKATRLNTLQLVAKLVSSVKLLERRAKLINRRYAMVSIYSKPEAKQLLISAYFVVTGTCGTLLLASLEDRSTDQIIRGLNLFRGDLAYIDITKDKAIVLYERVAQGYTFAITSCSQTPDAIKLQANQDRDAMNHT